MCSFIQNNSGSSIVNAIKSPRIIKYIFLNMLINNKHFIMFAFVNLSVLTLDEGD